MTDLKAIFDACAGTGVTVQQCPKLLEDIEDLLDDPMKLDGSVAQIRTWKKETTRMTKVLEDNARAAKDAALAAAGGDGAAAAAAEAVRTENVRLTSELGASRAALLDTDTLLKAAQTKLGVSEELCKTVQERARLSEEARGLVQGLLADCQEEVRELTKHVGDGRMSAPRVDVADRVATLLGELNDLMPGHLTDRVPEDLIVQISQEIVAAFTKNELKDVIRRLVSQLESAVHPGVRVESIRDMLHELEKEGGEREERRELTSAEEDVPRSRGRGV